MITEIKLLLFFIFVFIATWFSVLYLNRLARHFSFLLDIPNARKKHGRPTPMIGGLAIVPMLIFLTVLFAPYSAIETLSLALGMLLLFGIGVIDDSKDVSITIRLLVQIFVASLVVFGGGLSVESLGVLVSVDLGLGPLSEWLTIVCIVFLINAINMLDGMDGLAASIVIVNLLVLGCLSLVSGQSDFAFVLFLSVAPVLGFLIHNIRLSENDRCISFLGDNGSLALGLFLAWAAIYLQSAGKPSLMPITIALALAYPAGDSLGVFIRRMISRQNPMRADRSHLHHLLQESGFGTNQALLILVGLHSTYGLLAILLHCTRLSAEIQFVLMVSILIGHISAITMASAFVESMKKFRQRIRHFLNVR